MNTQQLLQLHASQTQLMIEVVNNQAEEDKKLILKLKTDLAQLHNAFDKLDDEHNGLMKKLADLELSLKGCEGELNAKNDHIAMQNLRIETLEQASEKKVAELQEQIDRQAEIIRGL